mmetsp:Transcript_54231/g.110666  ORF Transcript_54231/g.110666 Transcript_54231/m.110666 type:complete len:201 (-) Transcript_54231:1874-2476(-)
MLLQQQPKQPRIPCRALLHEREQQVEGSAARASRLALREAAGGLRITACRHIKEALVEDKVQQPLVHLLAVHSFLLPLALSQSLAGPRRPAPQRLLERGPEGDERLNRLEAPEQHLVLLGRVPHFQRRPLLHILHHRVRHLVQFRGKHGTQVGEGGCGSSGVVGGVRTAGGGDAAEAFSAREEVVEEGEKLSTLCGACRD